MQAEKILPMPQCQPVDTAPADNSAKAVGLDAVVAELRRIATLLQTRPLEPLLLGRREAAGLLGLSPATLDRLVQTGKLPAPEAIGGRRLFRLALLREFVAAGCPAVTEFEAVRKKR